MGGSWGPVLTSASESIGGQDIARFTAASIGAFNVCTHMFAVIVADTLINI